MKTRVNTLATLAILAGGALISEAPLRASVLFEVQVHFASGPVSLLGGQTGSACATNPDNSPVEVLIALLTADTSSLLASRQLTLQPGMGVCVSYPRPIQQPGNINQQVSPGIYAVVVPNGRFDANGRIVQDRPGGGGCIVASLQIQVNSVNNTAGQTMLFVPMLKHDHQGGPNND